MKYKKLMSLAFSLILSLSLCSCKNEEVLSSDTDINLSRYENTSSQSITDDIDSNITSDTTTEITTTTTTTESITEEPLPITQTAMSLVELINSDNVYFKTKVHDMEIEYEIIYCRVKNNAYIYNTLQSTEIIIDGNNVYQTHPEHKIYALVSDSKGNDYISQEIFGYKSFGYEFVESSTYLSGGQKISREKYVVDYYGTDLYSEWFFDDSNNLIRIEDDNLMTNGKTTFDEIVLELGEYHTDYFNCIDDYTEVDVATLSDSFSIME